MICKILKNSQTDKHKNGVTIRAALGLSALLDVTLVVKPQSVQSINFRLKTANWCKSTKMILKDVKL